MQISPNATISNVFMDKKGNTTTTFTPHPDAGKSNKIIVPGTNNTTGDVTNKDNIGRALATPPSQ